MFSAQKRIRRLQIAFVVSALAVGLSMAWVVLVPFPMELLEVESFVSTQVLDREGRLLRETLGEGSEGRARWVGPISPSAHIAKATIHTEDKRFLDHSGLDPVAIARAAVDNLKAGRIISGASTLTQQTVKMVKPRANRRSFRGKAMEAILAVRLELALEKGELLTHYLNRAPYGNQLFGVEAAAQAYFGKPAEQLSLAEAALLAGIPQSPARTEPLRHRDRAVQRQRVVLGLMRSRDAISEADYRRALTEELRFAPNQGLYRHTSRGRVRAPHFTDYVLSQAGTAPETLNTTLDLELQEKVEGIIDAQLERLEGRHVTQAAAIILDTRTGEVLAWVGSRDYQDVEHQGANDGVLALRQPGSTLKPFVYGLYLERGGTTADMFADLPTQLPTETGVYIPKNYDQTFHGPVSLRNALGSSLNIPAVVAAAEVGVSELLDRLHELGFDSLDQPPEVYGPGLALGNGEVTLLELANAYAVLGRLGKWRQTTPFTDAIPTTNPREVFSREVSYQLLDVLTDDSARSTGFGADGPLALPYRVAAKTGTSTDFRDNWAVGVTPDYTVAVWVGNFDGTPMQNVSGATGAAPTLRHLFQALYPDAAGPADVTWPAPPRGLRHHTVCTLSGQPATSHCPSTRRELFVSGRRGASAAPDIGGDRPAGPARCDHHVSVTIDTRNGLRAGPTCDPTFVKPHTFHKLPPHMVAWGHDHGLTPPPHAWSPHCPGEDPSAPPQDADLRITHPLPGDRLLIDHTAPPAARRVTLKATSPLSHTGQGLTWFIDGVPLRKVSSPYTTTWIPTPGDHVIGLGRDRVEVEVVIEVR